MQCLECKCQHLRKNGKNKQHKQKYICVSCSRQFILDYETHKGYSDELRKECLMMYFNGMGLRPIARVKKIHHTTVINWVKQVAQLLPNAYESEREPEVGELDELETFVAKKNKIWIWTAVNHFKQGILDWVMGDHSAQTFQPLWEEVKKWKCYFYVTDGPKVYPQFIPDEDQIISKTYMTRA